jgi:putative transposase
VGLVGPFGSTPPRSTTSPGAPTRRPSNDGSRRLQRHPKTIRVDNGSEFISHDLDLWAYANDVTLDFSRPGKPTDNGFIEAFNSKLRSECLNAHWFMSLADAREKLDAWRRDYNEVRPHSAIGYNVPVALHYPAGVTSPSS